MPRMSDDAHREALEKTLKLSAEVPATLAPWREWLAAQDVGGVILQPGIKRLSAKVQQGIQRMQSSMGAGENAQAAVAVFDMYAKMFQTAEKEVSACGFGLQLDKQNVLRVASRTLLAPEGKWARFVAQVRPAKENLLVGLPAGPFVAAGGGVVSDAMWDAMMKFSFDMMKSMPKVYGLDEEQINKMSEISGQVMKGVRGVSMVFGQSRAGSQSTRTRLR